MSVDHTYVVLFLSHADLARALIPRSVTVALALPIAMQLDAPLSITAAAVLLQGKCKCLDKKIQTERE